METIGLDGQTTIVSASSSASSTPGPGRAASAPSKRTAAYSHLVVEPDEVVLEADLGPGRAERAGLGQGHPRTQRVVGDRQEPDRHAAPCRQHGRDGAERLSGGQAARAEQVGGQVPVTQSEPVLAADARQLGQDVPGLAGHAPAGLAIVHAGQGVGHGVDVGADVQAVQHHVVAHVDQRRDVAGIHDTHQTREHPGGTDAAAQGDQHGVSIESWLGRSAREALVRSPPAMPQQIALDRHRTVVSVLREAASVNGDVEAYVEPATSGTARRSLTFGAWDRAADGVAGLLARHGLGKGDVVCLLLPSSIDYAVLYAALQRLGAMTSGINPRMGAAEVASIVERAAPVLAVVDPEAGSLPSTTSVATLSRAETAAAWDGPPPGVWPELDSHDPVAVVWTSGTTGRPKGAVFDHANLAAVARGTDLLSQPGDRRLSPLPFAHVAYMTRAWDEVAHAVTTVITPTPWKADDAIRIIAEERVTVGQGVPTQWALMLASAELEQADLSSLRIVSTGAARTTAAMIAEMRQRFGVPVVVRYTSTEASLGTGTTLDSSDEEVATTVGRPVPGVELAIVDDEGAALPDGEVGRVLLRSEAVMRGVLGPGSRRRPCRGRADRCRGDGDRPGRRRMADDGRLRGAPRVRQPAAGRAGARALHPRRLQHLSGRGRKGAWPPTRRWPGSP